MMTALIGRPSTIPRPAVPDDEMLQLANERIHSS
jgi:hypothetical protein